MTEDQNLEVLGGVTSGEQGEQLDGAVQREIGEFRQHQMTSEMGTEALPYRAVVDVPAQLRGTSEGCAPYTVIGCDRSGV